MSLKNVLERPHPKGMPLKEQDFLWKSAHIHVLSFDGGEGRLWDSTVSKSPSGSDVPGGSEDGRLGLVSWLWGFAPGKS